MKLLWKIFKACLLAWGAFSLVAVLFFGILSAWVIVRTPWGPVNHEPDKVASKKDVRFILNRCNLGEERIEEVLHSHISQKSFKGDHFDGHAIRLTHLDPAELLPPAKERTGGWMRGDELSGITETAVDFAAMWLPSPMSSNEIPWLPTIEEIRSEKMYVYVMSTYTFDLRLTSAKIIFARPDDKMIFYFSAKM